MADHALAGVERRRQRQRDRKRRERQRHRAGLEPYRLALRTDDVVEALIASEVLTEAKALRRDLVEAALAAVIHQWAARWRK
jgi:hypothetical protein